MGRPDTNRVTFIILRYMRRPILVLVVVYAILMVGWVLIPGPELTENGKPLSFFHAFYFLSYTATTTGFGEIPYEFTDAQRMWSIVSLYAGVVAWIYAIGAIVKLVRNPFFQRDLAENLFRKTVARIKEPFIILCGFGSTGSMLARGLSDARMTAVIIDKDPSRVQALQLRDYQVSMPGLCADASIPEHLINCGLLKSNCQAIVALSPREDINLKVAVTARLFNPAIAIIGQSTSKIYEESLAALGGDVHVVDPFNIYARYLTLTIENPNIHILSQWLSGSPGARLDNPVSIPGGRWVLCGYGRMGHAIARSLEASDIDSIAIEHPGIDPVREEAQVGAGRATKDTLLAAGIECAAGIVASTNIDSENLAILLNARAINPGIYTIVRQNRHHNRPLFDKARADFVMQPSLVGARRILFLLTAPLLKVFFEHLMSVSQNDDFSFVEEVTNRLRDTVGHEKPCLWTVQCNKQSTWGLASVLERGMSLTLADLLRDPGDRESQLACQPLVIRTAQGLEVMPELDQTVTLGDEILFCGRPHAIHLLETTLNNEYTLVYLKTGREATRSIVLKWLFKRFSIAATQPAEPAG